jgi:hypothetical protein
MIIYRVLYNGRPMLWTCYHQKSGFADASMSTPPVKVRYNYTTDNNNNNQYQIPLDSDSDTASFTTYSAPNTIPSTPSIPNTIAINFTSENGNDSGLFPMPSITDPIISDAFTPIMANVDSTMEVDNHPTTVLGDTEILEGDEGYVGVEEAEVEGLEGAEGAIAEQ